VKSSHGKPRPHGHGKPFTFDDGVDTRTSGHSSDPSRSALHDDGLCSQVAETLGLVFAGGGDDERLLDLGLLSVEPAPTVSRLLVKVYPLPGSPRRSVPEICSVLKAARPFLRREIAEAISRRKIPELAFEVVPGPLEGAGDDR